MATANSTPKLSTSAGRKQLPQRVDPYFQPYPGVTGASLGYRKLAPAGEERGTWIARLRVIADGKARYAFESLGEQKDHNAAAKAAGQWFDLRSKGITDVDVTVRQVCARYATAMETTNLHECGPRPEAARLLRLQHENWINHDAIADVALSKLTKAHVKAWRQRLEAKPDRHGKRRGNMSVNRELNCLRGPLNFAREELEVVPDDSAWRKALKPAKLAGDEGKRRLYLSNEECQQLLDAAEPDVRRLLTALLLLPLRPGAMTALKVSAFQKHTNVLTIGHDKTRKATGRSLPLPAPQAAFFAEQCKGKLPGAFMFTQADGSEWTARAWGRAVQAAREQAFDKGTAAFAKTTAYVMRHVSITNLVRAGVDLGTVADWAGTSVVEIQNHYRQFVPGDAARLAVLANGLRL